MRRRMSSLIDGYGLENLNEIDSCFKVDKRFIDTKFVRLDTADLIIPFFKIRFLHERDFPLYFRYGFLISAVKFRKYHCSPPLVG